MLLNAMASTVVPPSRTRRWTRVEYERLVELGVVRPGERLELIDGLLVVREPQGGRHAGTIRRVLAALRRALGDAWQIDSQLPVALDEVYLADRANTGLHIVRLTGEAAKIIGGN